MEKQRLVIFIWGKNKNLFSLACCQARLSISPGGILIAPLTVILLIEKTAGEKISQTKPPAKIKIKRAINFFFPDQPAEKFILFLRR